MWWTFKTPPSTSWSASAGRYVLPVCKRCMLLAMKIACTILHISRALCWAALMLFVVNDVVADSKHHPFSDHREGIATLQETWTEIQNGFVRCSNSDALFTILRSGFFWVRTKWQRKESEMSVESLTFFTREVKRRFTIPWSIGPTKAYHIVQSKRNVVRKRAKFKRVAKGTTIWASWVG